MAKPSGPIDPGGSGLEYFERKTIELLEQIIAQNEAAKEEAAEFREEVLEKFDNLNQDGDGFSIEG